MYMGMGMYVNMVMGTRTIKKMIMNMNLNTKITLATNMMLKTRMPDSTPVSSFRYRGQAGTDSHGTVR
jgi:hypothetical protein